jgi:RimJ/RimL family protein N-acetyltransferase
VTDFTLRTLDESDAPELQRVYDAAPATFTLLMGAPAAPGQAARDLAQARQCAGRFQFGAILDGEMIGIIDCQLSEETPGQAHIGLLLLADRYADPALAGLMVRMVTRWLAASHGVWRLEASALAHDQPGLAFWQSLGFEFTGRQYRRELPYYTPRFLVLAEELPEPRD